MPDRRERLLIVAHGTTSKTGSATTRSLVEAVATARPDLDVALGFLDVDQPRLATALDELSGDPTVLVPLLLSTGYHVQTDIPTAVDSHPHIRIARHLGPHPLLTDALVDRMPSVDDATATVLLGAGSTRDEALSELDEASQLLGKRLGCPVIVATMADDLSALFSRLHGPVRVATYLLAEGRFADAARTAAASSATDVHVAGPIGVHPALVELILLRYERVCGTR